MSATLDLLRGVGCKGFFVNGTAGEPSQLDWLKGFKDRMRSSSAADYKPNIIQFPLHPATGAYVKQLAPDTWWLPTLRLGKISNIGDGLQLYTFLDESKSYLWSTSGDRTITLKAGTAGYPSVEFPPSAHISKQTSKSGTGKNRKKVEMFSVSLTDVPTVLHGMDFDLIFPEETASAEIQRLADLQRLPTRPVWTLRTQGSDRKERNACLPMESRLPPLVLHKTASTRCLRSLARMCGWRANNPPRPTSMARRQCGARAEVWC